MLRIGKHIFQIYFLNIDISLIMKRTRMKTAIPDAEIHWEGSLSQNSDIGLSFCFILCRRVDFQANLKKIQKLHIFCF